MENHVCPWRHAYLFDNPLRRLLHNPDKILRPYVAPGMTVLDIGCGMGFFSIGMARLIGDNGLVISVDVQQEMLDVLRKRARRAGVVKRIQTHRCTSKDLGITTKVDFVLGFWMIHEVPDRAGLFRQIRSLLQAGGHLLVVEPKKHVSPKNFHETLKLAEAEGFRHTGDPTIRLSMTAVFSAAKIF